MKSKTVRQFFAALGAAGVLFLPVFASAKIPANSSIGNAALDRSFTVEDGVLRTAKLVNRINGREVASGGDEFRITLADDGRERQLAAADFEVVSAKTSDDGGTRTLTFDLHGKETPIDVTVKYWISGDEGWMRKSLTVLANKDVVILGLTVESVAAPDAYEAYNGNQFNARGAAKWRPPLGQPVYTKESAAWFGMEFPVARNQVVAGRFECRYLTKAALKAGEILVSHSVAWGVTDNSAFLQDAFFNYIDATRIRPLRLQTQYNSWFDYGQGVDAKKFAASVKLVNDELVTKRGVKPLKAYVIDDGWEDTGADWSKAGVWPVNGKFKPDFGDCFKAVHDADSQLGLWLSPGCLFGAQAAIPKMKAAGWKSLDPWMSMTGEDYMSALEKRLIGLAADGVGYFKLDGVFGHLNTRNFDIEGFKGGELELNDQKYDDAKERYLSLGSERLIRIFHRMAQANPNIYILISNGAFLSPWWLQHVDAVWMINADDAASGADRTAQLVYRDGIYYQLAAANHDNTQFPLNSIFNHEPKKISTGESADTFRRYLYLSLSRGTGFEDLYLKPFKLSDADWDVLAEGLKWADRMFPNFKRARMHGGDPQKGDAYGYTGWTDASGYVSFHNPSDQTTIEKITLDRAFGLPKAAASKIFQITSPLAGDTAGLPETIKVGDTLTVELPPKAIRLLEFQTAK